MIGGSVAYPNHATFCVQVVDRLERVTLKTKQII